MAASRRRPRRSQAGVTLTEVILGLSVLAVASVGVNQLAERFADDTRNAVAAGQLRSFGEAARSYIRDHYAAVQAVASTTTPALIDLSTLVAAGKLPVGFGASNAYGQATCALVFEPSANRLQALVLTEGGSAVGDASLASIAAAVGGSGGAVYDSDGTQLRGSAGGWALPVAGFHDRANHLGRRCDGSAGKVQLAPGHAAMALWFENGDSAAPFLAREEIPGRPELNAMQTPLLMNATRSAGASCTQPGAIAQDGTGKLLSCQDGAWKLAGDGACVLTTANLNNLQQDGRCYNGAGLTNSPAGADWVFVEVFRYVNHDVYYLVQRVTGLEGAAQGKVWLRSQNSSSRTGGWSAWRQQADPDVVIGGGDGNITAGGSIDAAGDVAGSYLSSSGHVRAADHLYAGKNVHAGSGVYGKLLSSSGDVVADGDVVSKQNAINYKGGTYNYGDSWGFLAYDADGGRNSDPESARGSAYVNDVYLRSKGMWASELHRSIVMRKGPTDTGGSSTARCASGETVVAGSCWGEDLCSGSDSSMHGGYPSGNSWVCPGWHCNATVAYATCMK